MAEHIVIERTDAEQPFHVRFVAGNGQRTFWCENLKNRRSAIRAIVRHAETFVGKHNAVVGREPITGVSVLYLQRDGSEPVGQVKIREVDSRSRG